MDIQSDLNNFQATAYKNEIKLKVSPFFSLRDLKARTRAIKS